MLLAATYLICWDADRIWAAAFHLMGSRKGPALLSGAHLIEKTGWVVGGVVGVCLFLITRSFIPRELTLPLLITGAGAFLLVVAGWIVQAFKRRSPGLAAE